jgi:UDP-N-acetylglucosamine acyltransferase
VVGPHCSIHGPTRIGRDNRFVGHAAIGGEPQDKKYAGERTELVIGDRNVFREFVTINRGTGGGGGITRIGDDNWMLAYTHIAHDCIVGNHCIFSNNTTLAGHVHVGDWVIISGFAGAHQFCRIGATPSSAWGADQRRRAAVHHGRRRNPGRPRGINSEGLKRRGFDAERIGAIKRAYRTLYVAGLPLAEAKLQLAEQAGQRRREAMLDFIEHADGRCCDDRRRRRRPSAPLLAGAGEASGDLLGAGLIRGRANATPMPNSPASAATRCAGRLPDLARQQRAGGDGAGSAAPPAAPAAPARRVPPRALDWQPDVFIGIDAPDFNLASSAGSQRGVRTVHYVSPSVWAWREKRAEKIGSSADLVLCLFPMEPPIYARHGIDARFVGHPMADDIPCRAPAPPCTRGARPADLGQGAGRAAGQPAGRDSPPGRTFFEAPGGLRTHARAARGGACRQCRLPRRWKSSSAPVPPADAPGAGRPGAQRDDRRRRGGVLASGTATLEAMLVKRPMVVGYRVNELTYRIVKALGLIKVDRFALPNILAGQDLAPELMQHDCTPDGWPAVQLVRHPQRVADLQPEYARLHAPAPQCRHARPRRWMP